MQSALFIGRFQPFHNGHLHVVKEILKQNERIIIVIGSAELNFLPANPLTAGERYELIEDALIEAKIPAKRYAIIPIPNINNYAIWVNHVNTYVPAYSKIYTGSEIVKACYEGKYDKPHLKTKVGPDLLHLERKFDVSATRIREALIENDPILEKFVPKAVYKKLQYWDIARRLKTINRSMDYKKYINDSN